MFIVLTPNVGARQGEKHGGVEACYVIQHKGMFIVLTPIVEARHGEKHGGVEASY
jgi:hypothetical protein